MSIPLTHLLLHVDTPDTPLTSCRYPWHTSYFMSIPLTHLLLQVNTPDTPLTSCRYPWHTSYLMSIPTTHLLLHVDTPDSPLTSCRYPRLTSYFISIPLTHDLLHVDTPDTPLTSWVLYNHFNKQWRSSVSFKVCAAHLFDIYIYVKTIAYVTLFHCKFLILILYIFYIISINHK
jgi:hypothetical protein